jgi:N utilization substance protein B
LTSPSSVFDEPAPLTSSRRRTQARMLAVQALCCYDALGDAFAAQLNEFLTDPNVHQDLGFAHSPGGEVYSFARELANGTWHARGELDTEIARASTEWSIRRMPPVDRNLIRLGAFELLRPQSQPIAPEVVINEAVELAKVFCDPDAPAFINGILDTLHRKHAAAP